TRLKWALQDQPPGWLAQGAQEWRDDIAGKLLDAWAGLPRPDAVVAASVVAAHAAHRTPCVLASAGTALALDALCADGRHLGGLIAPGVRLMQQSLLDATVLVRPQRAGDILELADNTADAVTSGCWQAAAALIERFHAHALRQLGAT